jgi:glycosyltransferase involved in cell wall biosynthesis
MKTVRANNHSVIYCLLPVRNGESYLPGYFDNIRRFCDGVIALDDGSTDTTYSLLAAEPLVKLILRNPVRAGYAGWDDAANRRRLLHECELLAPDWIIWLDADELILECDIPYLLRLICSAPWNEHAYGFEVLRMMDGLGHFDKHQLWVYRLFPFRRGHSLPVGKLHFDPIPLEIPRQHWKRTRLRIAHLSGMTAALRRARYDKYLACDPGGQWQASYEQLLDPPGYLWPVRSLPADVDIVLD